HQPPQRSHRLHSHRARHSDHLLRRRAGPLQLTNGGHTPYPRAMKSAFSTTTTQYKLISKLSTLRQNNDAVAYGSHKQRWMNNDVYIYERQFYNSTVLVAINKSDSTAYSI